MTDSAKGNARPEVWGGAEYTCNRVGDCWFDQMELSGHATRRRDLELFAELGIQALRCGLLWERHEASPDWRWTDSYLGAMREAGLRPIAGLVHHGSGPGHTGLLDSEFAPKLAAYAGEVAAHYPWIAAYTPVNEPNTTARFACRYGVWYPHHRSAESYFRALVNQTKATALSMRAIREVRPDAKLIQTDDLGAVRSTPQLQSTCDWMNERRWLAFDLLCGSVDRTHPLFASLLQHGITEHEIGWFHDHSCPPDVIGVNYYVTSDRFLDHRLDLYPHRCRSAEGPFADVEAVRVRGASLQGFGSVLLEASRRYRLPVAVTEVHLGDRVEEQIRWAAEAWRGALAASRLGADCVSVTFWALLGSYFWSGLVTADNGHYEPGVFDLRSGTPQPTALAELVRQCAHAEKPSSPALAEPGWWHRANRIQFEPDAELVA